MTEHRITRATPTHRRWDVTVPPVVMAQPGDVVIAETDDFAAGQITRDSPPSRLMELDFDLISPLAGPIHVAGAEPGDMTPAQFATFFQDESTKWAKVVKASGAKVD